MQLRCPHCHNPIQVVEEVLREVLCPGCGSSFRIEGSRTDLTTTAIGSRRVGKFELMERVGVGGFGSVYRARDTELDRIVAVKFAHPSLLESAADRERFMREARAAAQLRHPNIATVHEVQELDGIPTIVSDFVEGVTLRELLDIRKLTFRESAALTAEVAEALDYAHSMRLVHRDIKPGNIMIEFPKGMGSAGSFDPRSDSSGSHPRTSSEASSETANDADEFAFTNQRPRALLVDFGLALRDEAEVTMTVEGQIIGTPAYMSPEQAAGKSHHVDRRSDVYSLGVVLYELLCGEIPFRGSKVMMIHQVQREEPRSPRSINDKVPRDLETICLKAMSKQPGRRYATARAFANDLNRFLRYEPITARRVSQAERLARWCGRNPMVATMTAAIAILLVGGMATSSFFAFRANAYAKRADEKAADAISEKNRADSKAEEVRRNLYVAHMNLAKRAWEDANIDVVRDLLDRHRESDLRGFEWDYLDRLCHSDLLSFSGHTRSVQSVAFSPDGKRLASASNDRTIKLWNATNGEETLTLKGHTLGITGVAFSPDGKRLASASNDNTVKVWDASNGFEVMSLNARISPGNPQTLRCVVFSPDGKRLASAVHPNTVQLWDATSGKEVLTLKGHYKEIYGVAFSPDGKLLASCSNDGTVKIWDTTNGAEIRSHKGSSFGIKGVAFSPDGKRLASANSDQTIKVWDTKSGQESLTLKGHTSYVFGVAFSPDGTRLASASNDATVKVWDATNGSEIFTQKGHIGPVNSVAFSPDGMRIASAGADGTAKLWDATSSQEVFAFKGHTSYIRSVAFSPDGKRLASGGEDKTVRIWDTKSGQEILTLKGHTSGVRSVAFSADGKRLASGGDKTVRIWDTTTGQEILTLKGDTYGVSSVAFSPDGKRLASGGYDEDKAVIIWDAMSGQEILTLNGHTKFVSHLVFSVDGKRLAANGSDFSVMVWDATSGQLMSTLKGHSSMVMGIAFTPDGKRLASGSFDRMVKVWDVTSCHETLTLKINDGVVFSVAFSPDGNQLAAAVEGNTVKVWDCRPLTPELRDARRAALLANDLIAADDLKEKLAARLVKDLFTKGMLRDEVIAAISASTEASVTPAVRERALELARTTQENPNVLNQASWNVVRLADRPRDLYERALRQAELAFRLEPENRFFINTLGVAQYRVGQYDAAVASLTRSLELNAKQEVPPSGGEVAPLKPELHVLPVDVAFLAMAHHRLGHAEKATELFEQLRQLLQLDRWKSDAKSQSYLHEAESLIGAPKAKVGE